MAEDGTVLETFFLSETAAFAEEMKWRDQTFSRADILPVWHARYSKTLEEAVDQKEIEEELDAVTPAKELVEKILLEVDWGSEK